MNTINNDIFFHILSKDKENYINTGSLSTKFKHFYCSVKDENKVTDLSSMQDMVFDAIINEDIALFEYVYETSFFHHISVSNIKRYDAIFTTIIRDNKMKILKCFYKLVKNDPDCNIKIKYPSLDFLVKKVCTHGRLNILKYILKHIPHAYESGRSENMIFLTPILYDVSEFSKINSHIINYIYKTLLKRNPTLNEMRIIVMNALIHDKSDILSYMLHKHNTEYCTGTTFLETHLWFLSSAVHLNKGLDWAHKKKLFDKCHSHIDQVLEQAMMFKYRNVIIWVVDTCDPRSYNLWETVMKIARYDLLDFIHFIEPVDKLDSSLYLKVLDKISAIPEEKCLMALKWLKNHEVKITDEVNEFASHIIQAFYPDSIVID